MLFKKPIKLVLIISLFFINASSLFAFQTKDVILLPGFGFGFLGANSELYSGSEFSQHAAGNKTAWKNPKEKYSISFNVGLGFDYFTTKNIAITSGVFAERLSYKVVWPAGTTTYNYTNTMTFYYFTLPIGVRYYFERFMLGGGFYYSLNTSIDGEIKAGPIDSTSSLEESNVWGLFIDAGVNSQITKNSNVLLFIRYRQDLTYAYRIDFDSANDVKLIGLTLNVAYSMKI